MNFVNGITCKTIRKQQEKNSASEFLRLNILRFIFIFILYYKVLFISLIKRVRYIRN